MKEGKILAIIIVRKNSKRVAFKNLKKFSDSNLLEIKLKVNWERFVLIPTFVFLLIRRDFINFLFF